MIRKTSPIQVVGYGIGSKKEIFPRDGKQLNCHSLFSSFLSVQVSLYLVKKSVKSFEGFLGSFSFSAIVRLWVPWMFWGNAVRSLGIFCKDLLCGPEKSLKVLFCGETRLVIHLKPKT